MCRFLVQHQFLNRKPYQRAPLSMLHILFLGCVWNVLYYLARREPVKPRCSSCSVKYLEGDCWLRALEQRQRLFWCTGSSIAHRLPVGMDFCIHFGLCTVHWIGEIVLSSRETQIQSLKHASWGFSIFLFLYLFVLFGASIFSYLQCCTEPGQMSVKRNKIELHTLQHEFSCSVERQKWKFKC